MVTDQNDKNPYTRGIAAFASGLRYDHVPADVIGRIKLLMLDSLGCGIYGSLPEHSKILVKTLSRLDSSVECGVWGTRQRLSAPHAALANGSLVQGFELDDGHSRGSVHTGSGTFPVLMALAESRPAISGRQFLTAAVAAFETAPRVGMCMGQEYAGQGWHSGSLAAFPAAVAAASALGLSEDQTVHALGIAGTQVAGLMAAQFGSMVKRMHAGRGAQSGLYGALLAESGFTGIVNLFESEYGGFCTTFSRSNDRFDMTQLTRALGQEFETMRVSLKFYACAASCHTALDAIRQIRARRPFKADDVKHIVVHAAGLVVKHVGWKYQPIGLTSAQMNLPFCAATLILEDDVFVEQFTPEAVNDGSRMALADRIEVREDAAISAKGRISRYQVRVEVHFNDDSVLEETVDAARGSDRKFASEADVVGKFEKLASRVLPARQVAAICANVLQLEKMQDTRDLARLLVLS
jgi:aconitate decarboxylase